MCKGMGVEPFIHMAWTHFEIMVETLTLYNVASVAMFLESLSDLGKKNVPRMHGPFARNEGVFV